ncbi:MAG TPA: oligopeptide:H+ symporter, partial [Yinghuangia sp.]|nr:oligopeptide:H+ symporter [Yinghuangia sp.]
MTATATRVPPPDAPRGFLGQPRGLLTLVGIGLWERFSFYGMQVVLLYYLFFPAAKGGLGMSQDQAASIVGAYGGTVYLSTIVGAWVADRLLGAERTLFYSAVLILTGHIALAAIPGSPGVWLGLPLIALGSGGQISNVTASTGTLYGADDTRRDTGFLLFYMGLNAGALAGPLLTGFARTRLGFHYGFGLAAIGMAIGLTLYTLGRHGLGERGRRVPDPLPRSAVARTVAVTVGVVALVAAGCLSGVLTLDHAATAVMIAALALIAGYFTTMLRSAKVSPAERRRVRSLIPMVIVNCVFWALYQQQFTVVQIYAVSRVDLDILGFDMPPEWFNSAVPAFVIIFTPLLLLLWSRLGSREPSVPVKFLLGIVGIGISFLLFIPMADNKGAVNSPFALAGILVLFTLAELCVSPVQMSLSTAFAPKAFSNQMVSLWFLSTAAGSAGAGTLADFYSPNHEAS